MQKTTLLFLIIIVLAGVNEIQSGRGGGGGRISSGGSRSRGTGGSYSHSYGTSGSSHRATSNWNKAKDRVSQSQPKPQPKPQPQPNPDHHRLTYGQHESAPAPRPSPVDNKPKPQPNQDNAKLSYTPSAPPMEHASNKQTVTNQHAPSAPPMDHSGHQQAGNTHGWNVGQGQSPTQGQGQHGQPGNIGWNLAQNNPGAGGNPKPIGFDNVNKQAASGAVPGQTHATGQHATNTHVNQNQNYPGYNNPQGGYHPQGGYNNQPGGYPQQQGGYYNHPQGGYGGYGGHNYGYGNYHGSGGYGGYGGYHPGSSGGYTSFGGYNPPGTNIHYGPVTYINGHTAAPAYSYYHDRSDNTLLSLFVGYQVGKMFGSFGSSPSPYFNGHTYTVHHYHHDRTTVPEKVTVQANTIIACPENITLLCLSNSYPVCMSNGTIMCVSNPQLTVPCKEDANRQCVSSTIDCSNNNTSPLCTDKNVTLSAQNTTTLSVPCVSSVSIFGDLSLLQNVINATLPANATFNETTAANMTVMTMVTDGVNGTVTTTIVGGTDGGGTTTPAPTTTAAAVTTTTGLNAAQGQGQGGVTNIFCVTVIAVPAPLNQTVFNNVTQAAKQGQYATPLADPEVQEKMWGFFGSVLDHIFG